MLRAPFVLLINILSLLRFIWASFWFRLGYFFRRKNKLYIQLKLESNYHFGPAKGWAQYFRTQPSLLELRESLKRLARDPHVAGVVLIAESSAMGSGRRAEISRLLDALRENGKRVIAHAQMPMTNDYLTLTAADEIVLTPAGRLYTFGPRIEQLFAHQALEKLGVFPQFIHIGEFKTASHRFIHDQMTQAQRLMMSELLGGLKDLTLERIQTRRDISREQASKLFAQAPMDTAQARRAGFIDGELFREVLSEWVEGADEVTQLGTTPGPKNDRNTIRSTQKTGNNAKISPNPAPKPRKTLIMKSDDYLGAHPGKYQWRPLFRRPKRFALLDLSGMIVMPNMNMPGQGSVAIDPEEVIPALRRVRNSRLFAGVILHINSPGGSALASDMIWQAIDQLRQQKPVVAQCSDVVGSGGYYLAVGCDEIICERTTITGSIGVITGKMSAPQVPEKFGVHIDTLFENDADNFTSLTHPLSAEMMARMDADARAFYRRFLQRVGQARGLNRRSLHRYARGRVYLAEAAQERGLVDHIGGLDVATQRLAQLCGVDAKKTELSYIQHRRESLKGALRGSLLQSAQARRGHTSPANRAALELGAEWLDKLSEPALIAQLMRRDPILALMPWRMR